MWRQLTMMFAVAGCFTSLCAQPVAVIASSEGNATVTSAEHRTQAAHSFDWLPAGVTVETAKGARLVLAFANGRRYELGSGGRVSITADGPTDASGPLRELERLPPMPKLPVINLVSTAAAMGGMRVREDPTSVRLLFPHARLSTLPEHTVLRFKAGEAGSRHQVEVGDRAGNVLYRSETADTTVKVPADALQAGQLYVWRVRGSGGELLGEATFTTVPAETMARRQEFKGAIAESDTALLAAVDAQLGLFDEAADELRASLARSAHPEVRKLLDVIEEAMR